MRNANKRKLKPHSDFASKPTNEEADDMESEIPEYLRKRHREFVEKQQREARHNRRDNSNADKERSNEQRFDRSHDHKGGNHDRKGGNPRTQRFTEKGKKSFSGKQKGGHFDRNLFNMDDGD